MSGPIDETFTEQQLVPGTVLEFGCCPGQFTERMARRPELDILAVDLYEPETTRGFRFMQGDLMELDITDQFDNVCCVSSFEHAGIETGEMAEKGIDLEYHKIVAKKLISLVKPGGRLIITCPFGPNEVWFSDGKGHDSQDPTSIDAKWGYRTFTLETLKQLFSPLTCVHASAFERGAGDYFDLSSWSRIDVEKDHDKFTDEFVNCGVTGVVFENLAPSPGTGAQE